jgi:hypothetical protein
MPRTNIFDTEHQPNQADISYSYDTYLNRHVKYIRGCFAFLGTPDRVCMPA